MSKLIIRNYVVGIGDNVLESRIRSGLGSILAHSRRVQIELHQEDGESSAYTCKLLFVKGNGSRYALSNTQPNAEIAIDGALARARRAMIRRNLAPARSKNTSVTQEAAHSSQPR